MRDYMRDDMLKKNFINIFFLQNDENQSKFTIFNDNSSKISIFSSLEIPKKCFRFSEGDDDDDVDSEESIPEEYSAHQNFVIFSSKTTSKCAFNNRFNFGFTYSIFLKIIFVFKI